MYSRGSLHMAEQRQDNQLEPTYSSSVPILDVVLKTCRKQWTIGRVGERGSGISVLIARLDDDDDDQTFYNPTLRNYIINLFVLSACYRHILRLILASLKISCYSFIPLVFSVQIVHGLRTNNRFLFLFVRSKFYTSSVNRSLISYCWNSSIFGVHMNKGRLILPHQFRYDWFLWVFTQLLGLYVMDGDECMLSWPDVFQFDIFLSVAVSVVMRIFASRVFFLLFIHSAFLS